jgi:hypothetical protein
LSTNKRDMTRWEKDLPALPIMPPSWHGLPRGFP